MKKILTVFICLLFISNIAEAQFHRDNISFGVGPSIIYGDNAGIYSKLRVKAMPSFSLAYTYDYAQHWDIRTSVGIQFLDAGGIEQAPKKRWLDAHQAYDFKGQSVYLDIMPVYQFNPIKPGNRKHMISYYAGLGLGVMHVQREAKLGISGPQNAEGESTWRSVSEDQSTTSLYFPARVGISTNRFKQWDFGVEAVSFIATSNDIDGNTNRNKRIKPDMLFQLQFMVKRNLGTW